MKRLSFPGAEGLTAKAFQKGDAESLALYSPCERFRYLLSRRWAAPGSAGAAKGQALFVMLNPSTATEMQNDPTVERCERRARAWGYGGMDVANIFAYRATDPRVMRAAPDPIGPQNDAAIAAAAREAALVLCAWGSHGAHLGRGPAVAAALSAAGHPLFHLGLTQAGAPKHPLYIGYEVTPAPFVGGRG